MKQPSANRIDRHTFSMRRGLCLFLCLLLAACTLLCACGAQEHKPLREDETYLDGTWYYAERELLVGYRLFPDGTGFQYICGVTLPITYGVVGDTLTVSNNGELSDLPFSVTDDGLLIDGLLFKPVSDSATPEEIAALEASLDPSSEGAAAPWKNSSFWVFFAAIIVVCLLAVYRIKKRPR